MLAIMRVEVQSPPPCRNPRARRTYLVVTGRADENRPPRSDAIGRRDLDSLVSLASDDRANGREAEDGHRGTEEATCWC